MGLKIAKFKKNGNTYVDAYAKISGVHYNNDTKIAVFSVAIYPAKGSDNLIVKYTNYYAKIEESDIITRKCYARINTMISGLKAQIDERKARKLVIANDETKVLQIEAQIASLQRNDILQFDGAAEL